MISREKVLQLHTYLTNVNGTPVGILNTNMLESAINGQQWFESDFEQTCHVSFTINVCHVFRDGNKRTAYLILLSLGLAFNEYRLKDVILSVAKGEVRDTTHYIELVKTCLL